MRLGRGFGQEPQSKQSGRKSGKAVARKREKSGQKEERIGVEYGKKHEKEKARKKYEKRKAAGPAVREQRDCIGRQSIDRGRYRGLLSCFLSPALCARRVSCLPCAGCSIAGRIGTPGMLPARVRKNQLHPRNNRHAEFGMLPARARKTHGCCGRAPIKQANDARPEKPKNWRCLAGGAGIMQPVTF